MEGHELYGPPCFDKSTLSAIPLYSCIGLALPAWVQKALIKIIMTFLWTGTDAMQAGKCLVMWPSIQRLLDLGGLESPT
jgi:hypothetical protein